MKPTTRFALQSQGAWLLECTLYTEVQRCGTGLSPSPILFSKRFTSKPLLVMHLQTSMQGIRPTFHPEHFPIHSPLLEKSFLVSSPPLTYMLKFSEFSHLTSSLLITQLLISSPWRFRRHRNPRETKSCRMPRMHSQTFYVLSFSRS